MKNILDKILVFCFDAAIILLPIAVFLSLGLSLYYLYNYVKYNNLKGNIEKRLYDRNNKIYRDFSDEEAQQLAAASEKAWFAKEKFNFAINGVIVSSILCFALLQAKEIIFK